MNINKKITLIAFCAIFVQLFAFAEANDKEQLSFSGISVKKPEPKIEYKQIFTRPKRMVPVDKEKILTPCPQASIDTFEFTPYGPDEEMNYRAFLMGVYAGNVVARIGEPQGNYIPLYMHIETNDFFSKIKKFTSNLYSLVDMRTYFPITAEADAYVNDKHFATSVKFYHSRNRFSAKVIRDQKRYVINRDMPYGMQDVVSAFLHFRMRKLEKGASFCYYYLFDRKIWRVEGKVTGREKVNVKAGTFDAWVLEGKTIRTDKPQVAKYNRKAKIWVTADERRLIVKGSTDLLLGEATIELQSYTPPSKKKKLLASAEVVPVIPKQSSEPPKDVFNPLIEDATGSSNDAKTKSDVTPFNSDINQSVLPQ